MGARGSPQLLAADKNYLTREAARLSESVVVLEQRAHDLQERLVAAHAQHAALCEQLAQARPAAPPPEPPALGQRLAEIEQRSEVPHAS